MSNKDISHLEKRHQTDQAYLAHRKKSFKCNASFFSGALEEGEIYLSVTHNGYQWGGISLLQGEIDQVIEVLQKMRKK